VSSVISVLEKLVGALPRFLRTRKRKKILRPMLDDPRWKWRKLTTLAQSAGLGEQETRDLLIDMGARPSTGSGPEAWGLISRVDQP
jgi:hypothetical protein